jgi:hypothetical protein
MFLSHIVFRQISLALIYILFDKTQLYEISESSLINSVGYIFAVLYEKHPAVITGKMKIVLKLSKDHRFADLTEVS